MSSRVFQHNAQSQSKWSIQYISDVNDKSNPYGCSLQLKHDQHTCKECYQKIIENSRREMMKHKGNILFNMAVPPG